MLIALKHFGLLSASLCYKQKPLLNKSRTEDLDSLSVRFAYLYTPQLSKNYYLGKIGVLTRQSQAAGPPVQLEPVDLSVKTPVVLQVPRYSPAAIINAVARRVPSPSTTPTSPPPPPPSLCVSTGE
ncbi:hypothetical protein ALC56_00822 [Trachymyrmex septentrionalis]|uniref:Uncharacterized protein n=1 Tax=Trachymyrmex septentrionalis TaxID=34720 RepID=A0A195FWY2_9HYME|nr:hypothetical protein ALC56_00822 [Trachymyrmex septentrionalis]